MRRTEIAALVAVAVLTAIGAGALPKGVTTGLTGRYWANETRDGRPLAEVPGSMPVTLDLLRYLPATVRDHASAEWTGAIWIDAPGTHLFDLRSDDGSWLDVDGVPVVDNGGVHGARTARGTIALTSGWHHVRVRYFQAGAAMVLEWWWTPPGGRAQLVRASDLAPNDRA